MMSDVLLLHIYLFIKARRDNRSSRYQSIGIPKVDKYDKYGEDSCDVEGLASQRESRQVVCRCPHQGLHGTKDCDCTTLLALSSSALLYFCDAGTSATSTTSIILTPPFSCMIQLL